MPLPRVIQNLLLAFAVLVFVRPATAVETTGQMKIQCSDESGSPMLGAKISVSGPSMMGIREGITNYKGEAWMANVPSGLYTVLVELSGYQSKLVRDVRVRMGSMTPVEVVLKPFVAHEETIEIVEAKPTLDVESSSQGSSMTKEFLEDVPTGRSYQTIAQATAGVTGDSNPNVMGGASQENAWLLDGVNISDPVTGTFSMNFNYDSVEEVQILTGLYKAEYGQALGGIINVLTDSGSNEFENRTGVVYSNGSFSPRRDAVYQPNGEEIESSEFDTINDSLEISTASGGPIVKDRIWFHGSYNYSLYRSSKMGVEAPRRFEGHLLYGKITAMPHTSHRITVSGMSSPSNIDNTRQSNRVLPEAERRQTQGNNMVTARWEWFMSDQVVLNTQYTHMKEIIEVTPVPCTWDTSKPGKYCEEGQPEGYIDLWTPGITGKYDAYSRQNYATYYYDDRLMDNISMDLSLYLPEFLGSMEWKAGANVRWLGQDTVSGYTGNMWINERLEDEGDPSSVINYYWVERPGALHSTGSGTEFTAFIQDTWKPRQNLTLDLGLRYERAIFRNDVGRRIVNTQIFLPRASFSWDPKNNKKAKIFGGFGMFGDGGRIAVSSFLDENASGYKLFLGEYYDEYENNSWDAYYNERGQSDYELWENMAAPRSYEFTLGYDQLVWEQLMVGISGTTKLFRNLWEDDEVNLIWNEDGSATVGSQSGIYDDFFRLRTPTIARRDYFGVTLHVRQNLHRNFQVDSSLTYSVTKGLTDDYLTIALDNPVQYPHEYGFLPFDRPWVAKIAGSYRFPYMFTVGARFTYTSGSRYDRKYMSGKSTSYELYRMPMGSFDTLEAYSTLDLKVKKSFKMGQAGMLELAIEGSNLFNSRVATDIFSSELNAEGQIEAQSRQRPFSLEFQLYYQFK